MTHSASQKEALRRAIAVVFYTTRARYYYLALPGERLEAFHRQATTGAVSPEEFGAVLASGEGYPTVEICTRMAQDYGIVTPEQGGG